MNTDQINLLNDILSSHGKQTIDALAQYCLATGLTCLLICAGIFITLLLWDAKKIEGEYYRDLCLMLKYALTAFIIIAFVDTVPKVIAPEACAVYNLVSK